MRIEIWVSKSKKKCWGRGAGVRPRTERPEAASFPVWRRLEDKRREPRRGPAPRGQRALEGHPLKRIKRHDRIFQLVWGILVFLFFEWS